MSSRLKLFRKLPAAGSAAEKAAELATPHLREARRWWETGRSSTPKIGSPGFTVQNK